MTGERMNSVAVEKKRAYKKHVRCSFDEVEAEARETDKAMKEMLTKYGMGA